MKTVTMDWETYQKEITTAQENYDNGFESGAKAADERVKLILDYLRETLEKQSNVNPNKLRMLMEKAGEL